MHENREIITADMTISAVLKAHPGLMPLFSSHGLGQFENSEVLNTLGPLLKLSSALKTAGVNVEAFIRLLNETVSATNAGKIPSLSDDLSIQKELTMVALLPCGMKMPFTRALEVFARELGKKGGRELRYLIEGNVNYELTYYDYIDQIRDLSELPDIIVCSDINAFFHRGFVERFIETGAFVDVSPSCFNEDYGGTGYADPGGAYTMISSNLLVMVVDTRCLGELPMPESWADLLEPGFENRVVMRGQDGFFCNGVLLPFLRMYGMDGIRRLGRSVCSGMHPAEMVKKLSHKSEEGGPAVYIMPWFFAKKITRTEHARLIWPKEGGLISPVTMLVKRNRVDAVRDVVDYITGPELGQICADAFFPSVHPLVRNTLEGNRKMNWLGWDFLTNNDVGGLKEEIEAVFIEAFKKKKEE